MNYTDMVLQHCPLAVYESVVAADRKMNKTEEMLLFSEITSVPLTMSCAHGVVGKLATELKPASSPAYKNAVLLLAMRCRRELKGLDSASYDTLRQDMRQGILRILEDVQQSQFRGGILGVLGVYRIDLLEEIAARVDYKSLTNTGFLADWQFNEYAACMGDEEAPERLARILERSDAPILRQLFTDLKAKAMRGDSCLSDTALRALAQPYLKDGRVTHDVDGDGPPVSAYAQDLLDVL
jgi:hypothetical protein